MRPASVDRSAPDVMGVRKEPAQIAVMRKAGRVVAEMHDRIRAAIRPGVTTADLDQIGRDVLDHRGAKSNFLGYHGYPAVICASPRSSGRTSRSRTAR